jgi:hypothetical protein
MHSPGYRFKCGPPSLFRSPFPPGPCRLPVSYGATFSPSSVTETRKATPTFVLRELGLRRPMHALSFRNELEPTLLP